MIAKTLIEQTCHRQNIQPNMLTIHADRGSSMKSKPVAFLLADLGVVKTHSRPYTSNDNPFSEAQFKTLKYCPEFPKKFGCIEDAKLFCRAFFQWYNHEHRHSGISRLTPFSLHYGHADNVLKKRNNIRLEAFNKHPKRFKNKKPKILTAPQAVWINPPLTSQLTELAISPQANRSEALLKEANRPVGPVVKFGKNTKKDIFSAKNKHKEVKTL